VNELLAEISKFSQKKQQENLVAIKEIPSDVLNTKVIINGKEKAIKLLSSDEIIALQADSKDFPEPIKKYFEYKLQNKNL
jgi:tRNA splicing endonuclease